MTPVYRTLDTGRGTAVHVQWHDGYGTHRATGYCAHGEVGSLRSVARHIAHSRAFKAIAKGAMRVADMYSGGQASAALHVARRALHGARRAQHAAQAQMPHGRAPRPVRRALPAPRRPATSSATVERLRAARALVALLPARERAAIVRELLR